MDSLKKYLCWLLSLSAPRSGGSLASCPVRSTRKGAQAQSPKQGLEGKEVMSQGGRAGNPGRWHGEGQPPSPRRLCFETHPLSRLWGVLELSPHPDPAQAAVQLSGGAQASAFLKKSSRVMLICKQGGGLLRSCPLPTSM